MEPDKRKCWRDKVVRDVWPPFPTRLTRRRNDKPSRSDHMALVFAMPDQVILRGREERTPRRHDGEGPGHAAKSLTASNAANKRFVSRRRSTASQGPRRECLPASCAWTSRWGLFVSLCRRATTTTAGTSDASADDG